MMINKISRLALAAALTITTLAPAYAQSIRGRYTLPVVAIDANTFEVVEAGGAGSSQIWCAAGIFTKRVLGQSGGDIYIKVPRGPSQSMPGRKSVIFTTAPVDGAFTSNSRSVRQAGETHSMTHANAICRESGNVRIRTGPNEVIRN